MFYIFPESYLSSIRAGHFIRAQHKDGERHPPRITQSKNAFRDFSASDLLDSHEGFLIFWLNSIVNTPFLSILLIEAFTGFGGGGGLTNFLNFLLVVLALPGKVLGPKTIKINSFSCSW